MRRRRRPRLDRFDRDAGARRHPQPPRRVRGGGAGRRPQPRAARGAGARSSASRSRSRPLVCRRPRGAGRARRRCPRSTSCSTRSSASPGCPATLAALEHGKRLALANKESLIAGGPGGREPRASGGRRDRARRQRALGALPVPAGRPGRRGRSDSCSPPAAARSGATPVSSSAGVTVADALRHPTWDMGAKITIDSSTLMNKGLEVIEAHELFGVAFDRIDVVVHPQSIVHSMVEFVDGATIAQLSMPDMRLPDRARPRRAGPARPRRSAPSTGPPSGQLTFETPDLDAFPCLRLAFDAGRAGGGAPGGAERRQRGGGGGLPRRPDPVDAIADDRRRGPRRRHRERPRGRRRSRSGPGGARARHRRRRPIGAEPHERPVGGSRRRGQQSRRDRHPARCSSPAMVALAIFVAGSRTPLLLVARHHPHGDAPRVRPLLDGQAGGHEGHRVLRRLRAAAVVVHAGARPSTA